MKWTRALFSAMQFFQISLLMLAGVFCLSFVFFPTLKTRFLSYFITHDHLFVSIGCTAIVIATILSWGLYWIDQEVALEVKMGGTQTSIQEPLIASLFKSYLESRFPNQTFDPSVEISSSGVLSLKTQMPRFPAGDLKVHLTQMEKEVAALLMQTLHYKRAFHITFLQR